MSNRSVLATIFCLISAGCGGGKEEGGKSGSNSDEKTVVIDGSSTVFRISRAAAEAYQKVDSDVSVIVHNKGTGGGFGRYIKGECDIVDASRPAKPAEEKDASAAGMLPWTRYLVGYDGITIVVHSKNDFVKTLTVAQLKALFELGSKIKTWKDLDSSWPDRKITFFTPDNDSGTFEFFTEAINGTPKKQRKDVQPSSDDNQLVTGVANDVDAIGYFGYAYYAANKSKLKAVAVKKDDKAEAVLPSPATILDKSYSPLARPLYIYVKNAAMARPFFADFVGYYLENVASLAAAGGYVAPTADDIAANKKARATSGPSAKPAS